ncbi:UNVERIFIED_CONTAM: hypothetical protein FKN15_036972 [Acipenser sinensis]
MDKSALLGVPISPGHTFRPAVEEILQRSHREQDVALMLPSCAPVWERMRRWRPPVTQIVNRTVLILTVPRGDLRHRLQASMAANNQCRLQGRGNAGHGAPAQQRSGRQFQRHPWQLTSRLHPSLSSPSRAPEDLQPQINRFTTPATILVQLHLRLGYILERPSPGLGPQARTFLVPKKFTGRHAAYDRDRQPPPLKHRPPPRMSGFPSRAFGGRAGVPCCAEGKLLSSAGLSDSRYPSIRSSLSGHKCSPLCSSGSLCTCPLVAPFAGSLKRTGTFSGSSLNKAGGNGSLSGDSGGVSLSGGGGPLSLGGGALSGCGVCTGL